jgi:hypothetical protein
MKALTLLLIVLVVGLIAGAELARLKSESDG